MRTHKLPISSTWQAALRNWAAELRGGRYILEDDYRLTDYRPLLKPGGTMTIASSNIKLAQYTVRKPKVELEVSIDITFGGVASNIIFIGLPIPASAAAVACYTPMAVYLTDVTQVAAAAFIVSDSFVAVRPHGSVNFSLASPVSISISGSYRFQ